jgi:hypothetical protein
LVVLCGDQLPRGRIFGYRLTIKSTIDMARAFILRPKTESAVTLLQIVQEIHGTSPIWTEDVMAPESGYLLQGGDWAALEIGEGESYFMQFVNLDGDALYDAELVHGSEEEMQAAANNVSSRPLMFSEDE